VKHHRLNQLPKKLEPKLVLKLIVQEYKLAQEQEATLLVQEQKPTSEKLESVRELVPVTLGLVATKLLPSQGADNEH
jgi:hypothetical protein